MADTAPAAGVVAGAGGAGAAGSKPGDPTTADKMKMEQNKNEAARQKASKQNPLMNAVTDDYVDDAHAYKPRITKKKRKEYFDALSANGNKRFRTLPEGKSLN